MTREEFDQQFQAGAQEIDTLLRKAASRGYLDGTPRNLKAAPGLALSMADQIGKVLIAKGVLTEEEYFEIILDGLAAEKQYYNQQLEE